MMLWKQNFISDIVSLIFLWGKIKAFFKTYEDLGRGSIYFVDFMVCFRQVLDGINSDY